MFFSISFPTFDERSNGDMMVESCSTINRPDDAKFQNGNAEPEITDNDRDYAIDEQTTGRVESILVLPMFFPAAS